MNELSLALVSFFAATLLPFSSEAALFAGIAAGVPVLNAVIACSIGNCLACLLNFKIGDWLRDKMQHKMENSRGGRLSLHWMQRYGKASLFLSWLPIIGDPLTVVAGMARVGWLWFIGVICTLRIVRYVIIAGMIS